MVRSYIYQSFWSNLLPAVKDKFIRKISRTAYIKNSDFYAHSLLVLGIFNSSLVLLYDSSNSMVKYLEKDF